MMCTAISFKFATILKQLQKFSYKFNSFIKALQVKLFQIISIIFKQFTLSTIKSSSKIIFINNSVYYRFNCVNGDNSQVVLKGQCKMITLIAVLRLITLRYSLISARSQALRTLFIVDGAYLYVVVILQKYCFDKPLQAFKTLQVCGCYVFN